MSEFDTKAQQRLVDHDATDGDRQFAVWMHLSLLGNFVAPVIIIVVPLIMWLTKKDQSTFINDHGRETLNFHLTLMIYFFLLPIVALIVGAMLCGVGIIVTVPAAALLPYVLGIVGMIQASMAAGRGEYYRYPMTIRFLS
jgi:uncharacterized Tic20 family protein